MKGIIYEYDKFIIKKLYWFDLDFYKKYDVMEFCGISVI